jgi:hypothetical protein
MTWTEWLTRVYLEERPREGENAPFEKFVFQVPLVKDVSFVPLDNEEYLRTFPD